MKKLKLTNKEYNEAEGIRITDIRRILENPYCYAQGVQSESTKAFDLGSLTHALLLEPEIVSKDFETYEGGLGVTKRIAEIESRGKIAIAEKDFERASKAVEALKNSEAYNLFAGCENEISCFNEFLGFTLKCKIDALGNDYILDFKTTSLRNGASPDNFIKHCANFGYYIQAAHYMLITGIKKFLFVVLELEPPYMVGLYCLDNPSLDFGLDEVKRALEIYKNLDKFKNIYLDTKDFTKVMTLSLPNWVYYKA